MGITIDEGIQLAQLVISLLSSIWNKNPTQIEQNLLAIVQAGHAAYTAQTGKPIDSSLIQPIPPLP